MRDFDIRKKQFTVSDFVSWQREGSLDMNPPFQRRSVWKPDAKSYFIDTVVKGLPAPIIYLRQRVDLDTQKTVREVVDGQQRLRTLFAYIDAGIIKGYDSTRDAFMIRSVHNKDLAGKPYSKLPADVKKRILSYEFSTHVLPIDVEDQEVLEMFARLNATGVKLNHQELRNAEYFGEFKTSMYTLALEQLELWRKWKVFTNDQISRMKEVEATSDFVLNMLKGLTGKTQKRLDDIYKEFDQSFPAKAEVERRFRSTLDEIDSFFGSDLSKTVFTSEVYFFSLFVFIYDLRYGLGSTMSRRPARKLPQGLKKALMAVSGKFDSEQVPKDVLDAVQRASADQGRRETRLKYMRKTCNA